MKHRLYYSTRCGYCIRVLRVIEELELDIELCDVWADREAYSHLHETTGRGTVPCLFRIDEDGEEEWLFESRHIADYLRTLPG